MTNLVEHDPFDTSAGLADLMARTDQAEADQRGAVVSELNATAAPLLGLLHEFPQTGGQLVAAVRDRFGSFFNAVEPAVRDHGRR